MARRTIDVQLGEYTFKLTSLPGEQALLTYHRLLKHVLPPLVQVFESVSKGQSLASGFAGASALMQRQVDFEKLGQAVRGLFATLDANELQALRRELLTGAAVLYPPDEQGRQGLGQLSDRAVFDAVFSENVHLVFELLWEAIKLNYSRFFDGLRERLAAAQAANQSSSQKTS